MSKLFGLFAMFLILNAPLMAENNSFNKDHAEKLFHKEFPDESAVTYVRIFGGMIFLPNRYALIVNKINYQAFYLSQSGSVAFGKYDNLKKHDLPYLQYLDKTKKSKTTYCGIEVVEYGPLGGLFFVHNHDDYMIVADSDRNLWQVFLFTYCESKKS